MTKALYNAPAPNTCGVGILGIFRNFGVDQNYYGHVKTADITKIKPLGGAGWVMAGFTTERPEYKQAYEELSKRWPIVYQSPVRKNKRSGRQFFFCIFDSSKEKK